mmetsp:Transcript_37440/g.88989  ORF Transcript_37440/g.88989 Transcript_37440/m.88989 type:complete len:243 (-) Transcript_37440:1069-1797(-)
MLLIVWCEHESRRRYASTLRSACRAPATSPVPTSLSTSCPSSVSSGKAPLLSSPAMTWTASSRLAQCTTAPEDEAGHSAGAAARRARMATDLSPSQRCSTTSSAEMRRRGGFEASRASARQRRILSRETTRLWRRSRVTLEAQSRAFSSVRPPWQRSSDEGRSSRSASQNSSTRDSHLASQPGTRSPGRPSAAERRPWRSRRLLSSSVSASVHARRMRAVRCANVWRSFATCMKSLAPAYAR